MLKEILFSAIVLISLWSLVSTGTSKLSYNVKMDLVGGMELDPKSVGLIEVEI